MSDPHPGLSPNTGESLPPASHIERLELAIVDYLKPHLPNDVTVMAQVDDPDHFDISNCDRVVMVHFAQNTPIGHRDRLAGTTGFALICLAKQLRGAMGGYALVELVEKAMASAELPGSTAFAVKRSKLDAQVGGLWRWIVEVETETVRGCVKSPAAAFIPQN